MKERPILFSGQMVRAILAGRKTQTRRVVKPYEPRLSNKAVPDDVVVTYAPKGGGGGLTHRGCPYGAVGDRLWVRENFRIEQTAERETVYYMADEEWHKGAGWKPSIHMPRSLCRIELEITAVRIEPLHNITSKDARAEGVTDDMSYVPVGFTSPNPPLTIDPREGFARLWRKINGDRSWQDNPFVWVVEFKVVRP